MHEHKQLKRLQRRQSWRLLLLLLLQFTIICAVYHAQQLSQFQAVTVFFNRSQLHCRCFAQTNG